MRFLRPLLMILVGLGGAAASAQVDPNTVWTQATVYRDEWGVPHIYADNPRAMAFAFGYTQAEDHLEAMLMAYRIANGRAAEVLGESFARSDEFALQMAHGLLAAEYYPRADPTTMELCEGFAQGVNAWIVQHPGQAPPWADGVRPVDVLALLHCYLMSLAPFDLPGTYHMPPPTFSGNAWALAPARSATGEAMLAINPHTYYDRPFRWYEAHLACQDYHMSGATLFGLPVILMGHNDNLGWALTPNRPDFADIYAEPEIEVPRDPKSINAPRVDPRALLYMRMAARTRTYFVQGPGGLQPRGVPCLFSSRGPIIGEHRGRMCSYRIGGYAEFGALRQFVEMGRARDLASFQAALTLHQIPCFHIVYADRAGNIFYLYNAKMADKAAQPPESESDGTLQIIDWNLPVPADNMMYQWRGYIPVAALPAVTNPEAGYLQACGTPPWGVTDNPGINPGAFPPWFSLDPDTYRAKRARHLLKLGVRSFGEMQSMLFDVLVPFAVDSVPNLLRAAEANPEFIAQAHPDVPVGLNLLRQWNYTADPESTGMTFFHVWWSTLKEAVAPNFRNEYELMEAVRLGAPPLPEVSLRAAAEAAKRMRNEYQTMTVPWGEVHRTGRGDRDLPLAGGETGEPLFFSSDHRLERGKWTAHYGYGYAMVVRFGETPEAVSLLPFGESDNPVSEHYADQFELMSQRRMKPMRFDQSDVLAHAASAFGRIVRLHPRGMEAEFLVATPYPVLTRMESSPEPPAPLPEGLATFTVYAMPRDLPVGGPLEIQMTIRIAPELCDPANLGRLSVYGWSERTGWTRLQGQTLDAPESTFLAQDHQPRVYAVLGPLECRKTDDIPQPVVPEPLELAGRLESPGSPAAIFKVAEPRPTRDLRTSEPTEEAPSEESSAPMVPFVAAAPAEPASEEATPPAPEAPAEAEETPEPEAPAEAQEAPEPVVIALGPNSAPPPAPAAPQTEAVPLEEIKVKAAGPQASGKTLQIRSPDLGSVFLLSARTSIQARLVTLESAPARLPEGMAVFSEYLGLERMPRDARVEATLKVAVSEGSCAPENFDKLRVYGYRPDRGWYELSSQKPDADTQSCAAFERVARGLRVYAVLGPVECRLKP